MKSLQILLVFFALFSIAACANKDSGLNFSEQYKGKYKIGKPYWIKGQRYVPKEDKSYDEIGIASWYGPGFHGKSTANGEIYDQYDITAAHKTLPLPIMVKVTNLENGKNMNIRINDRGPFVRGRIIDLSKKSAQLLGIDGIAKVRVQYLGKETEVMLAERFPDIAPSRTMFAKNESKKPITKYDEKTHYKQPVIAFKSKDLMPPQPKEQKINVASISLNDFVNKKQEQSNEELSNLWEGQ